MVEQKYLYINPFFPNCLASFYGVIPSLTTLYLFHSSCWNRTYCVFCISWYRILRALGWSRLHCCADLCLWCQEYAYLIYWISLFKFLSIVVFFVDGYNFWLFSTDMYVHWTYPLNHYVLAYIFLYYKYHKYSLMTLLLILSWDRSFDSTRTTSTMDIIPTESSTATDLSVGTHYRCILRS